MRKGVIMAAGNGTRLYPLTTSVSKHLLPIFDKPMIYYPLSTLMLAGIRDIIMVVNVGDKNAYQKLLGDGSHLGVNISYVEQAKAGGIAEGLIICAEAIGDDPCALILGDNVFHGNELISCLKNADRKRDVATLFAIPVSDPSRYGVVSFDSSGTVLNIEEKPSKPKSRMAVTGLYFYPAGISSVVEELEVSDRGELEITDLNNVLRRRGLIEVEQLGRGHVWIDAGTQTALLEASHFISTLQQRLGCKIGVPEEVAFRSGWLTSAGLSALCSQMPKTDYCSYLKGLLSEV